MGDRFNPDALHLARQYSGKNQKELAEAVGVTQPQVSKWEKDVQAPQGEQLERLSAVLGFPRSFFFVPARSHKPITPFHRKRQSLRVSEQEKAEAIGNLKLMHISTLVEGIEMDVDVPGLDPDTYKGGAAEVARVVRTAWRLPKGPIDNMTRLIEGKGVFVFFQDFGSAHLEGFTLIGDSTHPIVFANAEYSADATRLTLAHELGHIVMHQIISPEAENEAWEFAAEFLMPEEEIYPHLKEANSLKRFFELKHYWKVSVAALIRRSRSLGIIDANRYKSLMIQMAPYRKKEPVVLSPEPPTLADELFTTYRRDLHYSIEELAKALNITVEMLKDLYFRNEFGPRLRLVK